MASTKYVIEENSDYNLNMGAQWLSGRDRGAAGSSLTGVTTLCP